jgi:ATP-dependent DNA helicase RecQ
MEKVLLKHFGYSTFRPQQKEIISDVLEGKDVLALMPTGGGKSICYQLPAMILPGLTVVISPLIALMKDQVESLKQNGIEAEYLNSTQTSKEQQIIEAQVRAGVIKLLYVAPERLFSGAEPLIHDLSDFNIGLFAIDEAHCISHWGHDFRPEYLKLSMLKKLYPKVPVIALTATADKRTRDDMVKNLALFDPGIFISSFDRENISYFVEQKQNSKDRLLKFLTNHNTDSGIIYTLARKTTEQLADWLTSYGFSALPYHAGLDPKKRAKNQELFIRDEVKIIVATIAFGMGIDKSNVRFIVHWNLPKNIEGYYQETGRAGRDGMPSEALLFFSRGDAHMLRQFISDMDDQEQQNILYKKLDQMINLCETRNCRRKTILNYFDEAHDGNCGSCDVCLENNTYFDGTVIAQKALSAIIRLKESYGTGFVVDFLRGSKSEKIKSFHRQIKTYGVGSDLSKDDWFKHIRSMIDQGLIQIADGKYPVLKITQNGAEVLAGKRNVSLISIEERASNTVVKDENTISLFNHLKTIRKELATSANVAAYMILSDKTLDELASYRPFKLEQITAISGFGEVKAAKYGERFTKEIKDYCDKNGLESNMKANTRPVRVPKKRKKPTSVSPTVITTLEYFENGLDYQAISSKRGMTEATILNHLCQLIENKKIKVDAVIAPETVASIAPMIDQEKVQSLTEIREQLDNKYSFNEIKLVRSSLSFPH